MNRRIYWAIMQAGCRVMTSLWFSLKVYGPTRLPPRGGLLLLANHQSFLDPVLIGVRLNRELSFMARSGLFENPKFAWLIRSLNAFPVRQGEGDIGAVRESVKRLSEGHVLNIFPEGTRTENGELTPIQPGVSLIIRKARVPIVFCAIEGSFEAWPKGSKLFRRRPIRLLFSEPVRLDHLKADQIVKAVQEKLAGLIAELKKKP